MSLFASVVFLLLAAGNGVVLSDQAGEEGEIQSAPVWEEQLKEQAAFTQDQAKAEKIIGGSFFGPSFPHPVVLIRTHSVRYGRNMAGTCTGTILNSRTILTAAHCFTENNGYDGSVKEKNVQQISVYVGVKNITELRMIQYYGSNQVPHAQVISIKMNKQSVVLNPGWFHSLDWKRDNKASLADIAILKLDEPIEFERTRSTPARFFARDHRHPDNREGMAVGWGIVRWPDSSKELKKAKIETKTLNWCTRKSSQMGFTKGTMSIPDVFCGVGKSRNNDSPQICFGDSGGPLFYFNQGKLVQVGISVWVDRTCSENFNGFLRINQHLEWISEQITAGEELEIVGISKSSFIQREKAAIMAGNREDVDEEGKLVTTPVLEEDLHQFHENDDSQNPFYDREVETYVNTDPGRNDHVLDLILSCTS